MRRSWASQEALVVKNLPMQETWETWVGSLGQEDPMKEGMATHSSVLVWRTLMDRGAWQATVHRVSKSQTWLKQLSTHVRRSSLRCIIIKLPKIKDKKRLLKQLVTSCYKAICRFVRRNFTGQKKSRARYSKRWREKKANKEYSIQQSCPSEIKERWDFPRQTKSWGSSSLPDLP